MADTSSKYYEIGNYAGPGTYTAPSAQTVKDAMSKGEAKIVDVYPEYFNNNGWGDNRYLIKSPNNPPQYAPDENGNMVDVANPQPQKALLMNGKVYIQNNDWSIAPVQGVVGQSTSPNPDDFGNYYQENIYGDVPGKFTLRTRSNGNVFDNLSLAFDPTSGQATGVGQNIYQNGSNGGGGFGGFGGFLGGALGGIQDLITSSPVVPVAAAIMMPGVGAAIAAELGVSTAVGTAIANAAFQAASGKDVQDIITNTALATAGSAIGSDVNKAVDTSLSDLGKAGDVAGNVAGRAAAGYVASGGNADPMALLQSGAIGEGVGAIASQVPGYDSLSPSAKQSVIRAITSTVQGKDPTSALINAALKVGKDAADSAPQDDGTTAGIQDVIDQIQKAPQDDGTTAGIQEIIDQTQTGAVDDGTTAGIQDVIDQTQTGAMDDGTTAGIQDVIDQMQEVAMDDGTTAGIQDIIDQTQNEAADDGTTEGIQDTINQINQDDFYKQIGIDPGTLTDQAPLTQKEIDSIINGEAYQPEQAGGSQTAGTGTGASTGTTGAGTTSISTGGQKAAVQGLDMASLIAALGLGGVQSQAQAPQPIPVVGESAGFDFSQPLDTSLFGHAAQQKKSQNQTGTTKISTGGYLDDLLDSIK